jgi:hypothetical protein
MTRVLSDIPSISIVAFLVYLFQMQTLSPTRSSKKKVFHWNYKFKELSTLQIKTAVNTNVAECKFLREVLLLNHRTIFRGEQHRQVNFQSVLASPNTSWNFDSLRFF